MFLLSQYANTFNVYSINAPCFAIYPMFSKLLVTYRLTDTHTQILEMLSHLKIGVNFQAFLERASPVFLTTSSSCNTVHKIVTIVGVGSGIKWLLLEVNNTSTYMSKCSYLFQGRLLDTGSCPVVVND